MVTLLLVSSQETAYAHAIVQGVKDLHLPSNNLVARCYSAFHLKSRIFKILKLSTFF